MSLDFSYRGENLAGEELREVIFSVPDPDDPEHNFMGAASHAIIFAHLTTGVRLVDEASAVEFYTRAALWSRLHNFGDPLFTVADVIRHINMDTNCTLRTEEEWLDYMRHDIARSAEFFRSMVERDRLNPAQT